MQIKDLIDIFTSSGGLLVSLSSLILAMIVAVITARSGKDDEQRTLRNQLTDTFNQMFATGLQLGQHLMNKNGNYEQLQYITSTLNQQYISLLAQATFLAGKIDKLVTPVEFNTIASSNANIGEFEQANIYARKAIDACPKDDPALLARALGSYGMILFMQSNFDAGDAQFKEALRILKEANLEKNFAHYLTGSIYSMWATYEKQWSAPAGTADEHFADAESEFKAIEIPRTRERALKELNEMKTNLATKPLPAVGQSQGVQIQQSIFNQMRTPGWLQHS